MRNTKRITKVNKLLIAIIALLFFCSIAITLALFTDQSDEFTADLNFGTVEINTVVNDTPGQTDVDFIVARANGDIATYAMPGDTVTLKVSIQNVGTADCYYMVSISSDDDIFGANFNSEVYLSGSQIKNASSSELGVLTADESGNGNGETHVLNISKYIPLELEEEGLSLSQTVKCVVYAVQKANLSVDQAYEELTNAVVVSTDDLTFTLLSGGNSYAVTGMTGEGSKVVIPAEYQGKPVTKIAATAFRNKQISSITIPASVTTIENLSFENSGLTELILGEGRTAIDFVDSISWYFPSLEKVVIPTTVTAIADSKFVNCSNLKNVKFTSGSTCASIGAEAFRNCDSLTTITIPASVQTLGGSAFMNSKGLTSVYFEGGSTLSSIGSSAFYGCSELTKIALPNSVQTLGSTAFYDCSNLKEVTLSNNLSALNSQTFSECKELNNINIPASVNSIGYSCFYNCKKLEKVTFGANSNLTSIGNSAFQNSGLTSFTLPSKVTTIGTDAFYQPSTHALRTVVNLTDKVILHGNSNTEFGRLGQTADMIFNSEVKWSESTVNGITYRTYIPKSGSTLSFMTIDNPALQTKTSFKVAVAVSDINASTYNLASDIDGIGYDIFQTTLGDASNLYNITIPANVKSIGVNAFNGQYNLHVIVNLSSLNLKEVSHLANYGCATYYAGELYNKEVTITKTSDANGVQYFNVTGEGINDLIAYGYEGSATSVTLDANTTVLAYKTFDGTSVTSINASACNNLRKIQYKALGSATIDLGTNSANWYSTNGTTETAVEASAVKGSSVFVRKIA